MATKKYNWEATIIADYKKSNYGSVVIDQVNVKATTYAQAIKMAQKFVQPSLKKYNADKNNNHLGSKVNARIGYASITHDELRNDIVGRRTSNFKEATDNLHKLIKQIFPNETVLDLMQKRGGDLGINNEFTQMKGISTVFSAFIPFAVRDGLNQNDLKDYLDLVIERGAIELMNIPNSRAQQLMDENQKERNLVYAKLRDKLTENTKEEMDGMHGFQRHEYLLEKQKRAEANAYRRKQNFAFEDGGVISGFNYSIGGL
jgi:hypothetical protein